MKQRYFNSENKIDFDEVVELLKNKSTPLENSSDLDPLMELIGDAKYVLIGEASHGTHEYYTWRAKITKRLIMEKNFSFVAVEGDWPDCYRVNRFAKGYLNSGRDTRSVLNEFNRWPTWMWANWEMVAFIDWLKNYNENFSSEKRIGFYGLDVYSFRESLDAIITYLEKNDTKTLSQAKKVLECIEPYGKDEGQSYARASITLPELCEKEILELLRKIQNNVENYNSDAENVFSTEQNAYIAKNAEKYYRAMLKGGPDSWNIRDRHMVFTLDRLMEFHGKHSKTIIWEHNTHIGDARATDMASEGMVNVGQLLKESHEKKDVVSIGFGSYKGTVIAGRSWGDIMRSIKVPKAIDGSWEQAFHVASEGENKLLLTADIETEKCVSSYIGHRAIGVVYNPEYEKFGNYVPSILPKRYDAFIFIDRTNALLPLHIIPDGSQIPETYPFGM